MERHPAIKEEMYDGCQIRTTLTNGVRAGAFFSPHVKKHNAFEMFHYYSWRILSTNIATFYLFIMTFA